MQACRPSSPITSSRKKWGRIRLPTKRPWKSVNMHRTVSISPASASSSSCFASIMPCCGIAPPHYGGARRPLPAAALRTAFRLALASRRRRGRRHPRGRGAGSPPKDRLLLGGTRRVGLPWDPLLARCEGELLLGRQHETVPPGDREVEQSEDVVDRHSVDARPIVLVEEDRHERH